MQRRATNPELQRELYIAVLKGKTAEVKKLINQGANPNYIYDGATLLHLAADKNRVEIVKILLESGADHTIFSNNHKKWEDGISARDIAREKNNQQIRDLLPAAIDNQDWLILRIQTLGYYPGLNIPGICLGTGMLAIIAALSENLETHLKRYKLMAQIPLNEFRDTVQSLKQTVANISSNISLETMRIVKPNDIINESNLNKYLKQLNEKEKKLFFKLKKQKMSAYLASLSEEEQLMLSIPAFCDSVLILQHLEIQPSSSSFINNLKRWFRNTPEAMDLEDFFPLLTPSALEEVGGIAFATCFSGIYTQDEIVKYFESLEIFLRNQFSHPVGLLQSSTNHAISSIYYPKIAPWVFFDINRYRPWVNISNLKNFPQNIIPAFFYQNDIAAFSTTIYVAKAYREELMAILNKWQETETWKNMHSVTPHKASMHAYNTNISPWTSPMITWFDVSGDGNSSSLSKELLKHRRNYINVSNKTLLVINVLTLSYALLYVLTDRLISKKPSDSLVVFAAMVVLFPTIMTMLITKIQDFGVISCAKKREISIANLAQAEKSAALSSQSIFKIEHTEKDSTPTSSQKNSQKI